MYRFFTCEYIKSLRCIVGNMVNSIRTELPYDAGEQDGNITLDATDGYFQKILLNGGVSNVFMAPDGYEEGRWLTVRITNQMGLDRTLDFDMSILKPSNSALIFPVTLQQGETYIIRLYYNGSAWELVTFVGGYA